MGFRILPTAFAIVVALGLIPYAGAAFATGDATAPQPHRAPLVFAQAQQDLFRGVGIVTDVNRETGSLTVNHEDIPGLMPKMEMLFRVEPRGLSEAVRPGDKIEFSVEAKTYKIRGLKVVEQAK